MSAITVVIVIWALYKLFSSAIKKNGMQQTPGKLSDSLKLPEGSSIRDVIQGISRGTWREQLRQALENGSYQARSMESTESEDSEETMDYVEPEGTRGTEGTQGIEGLQGNEGTSDYVGILGTEAYKGTEVTLGEDLARNPSSLVGVQLSLTQRDLVQGVMWAEILGKPRAMHPYRGPRT